MQSDEVVMDLTKLFQCSVMEEFTDIMSDSVKSMGINNTSEWWALRTSLDVRMKVNNTAPCLFRFNIFYNIATC